MYPCTILTDHPHLGGLRDHLSPAYVAEEKESGRGGRERREGEEGGKREGKGEERDGR